MCMYTDYCSIRGLVNLLMFLSLLCSLRLHLFDQKYSKNSNTLKYF